MTYTVEIYRSAQKQLGKVNTADRNKIYNAIRALAEDPRPENCKKLKGKSTGIYE